MKKLKLLTFLFVITVLLCAVGCGQDSDNTAPDNSKTNGSEALTPEKAVDIYFSERDTWMYSAETVPLNGYGYCFIDLDFDGVPELITSACDGSGKYSYNSFYKIDRETRQVTEIQPASSVKGESHIDYYYMANDSKLLKNKADGTLFYLFADTIRVGSDEGVISRAKIYIKEGKLFEETVFSEYQHPDYDNNFAPLTDYSFNGETVTSDEYEKAVEDFYKENEDMGLVWKYVFGDDFENASDSEKKALLLDAYLAFSYRAD